MKFIARFKPTEFWPVPEGTILRYRGHTYNLDTQQYEVWMDVIGCPPKDWDVKGNTILKVDDTIHIPVVE